jgi:hypothetical protein
MKAIISFLIFTSLTSTVVVNDVQKDQLIKESIFITMERTPCFGKCPSYKITIFNTGNVAYEGYKFAKKEGKYTAKLTKPQLSELKAKIEAINLFELQSKYDSKITDIPSCILLVNHNGNTKKILDRDGAPVEIKEFEKLIDALVLTDDLKQVEK